MGDVKRRFKVLVVGDIMIDVYKRVCTSRNAPEAPKCPVWDVEEVDQRLGGAGNVANNIVSLGGLDVDVFLAGIIKNSDKRFVNLNGISVNFCAGTETMTKTRWVDRDERFIFREDNFKKFTASDHLHFLESLDKNLLSLQFDAIVYSDYNKGTIDERVISYLENRSKLVIVDSKRRDLRMYKGSKILKVNEDEHSAQIAGPYAGIGDCVEALFEYVVVTKGRKGAELRQYDQSKSNSRKHVIHSEHFPVIEAPVKDVTGCGDTHTAAMTWALLNQTDVRTAVRFANECSRSVVQKFGTSLVDQKPLQM